MSNTIFPSPLRYPGGKRKVSNYVKLLFELNDLVNGEYAEPYAGGCSVALTLLFEQYASRILINDIDPAVFSFWHSVLYDTDELCKRIKDATLTLDEWRRQRQRISADDTDSLTRGFAAFYLNRTNRSGIIMGGIIGGQDQTGKWKMDARFNKQELIGRIEKVAAFRDRIKLTNYDALDFIGKVIPIMSAKSLVYFDPPYFHQGQGLYANFYTEKNHGDVAKAIAAVDKPWLVSYDNTPEIQKLYSQFPTINYGLNYSAQDRYEGKEAMFFSPGLKYPDIPNPSKVTKKQLAIVAARPKERTLFSLGA